MPIAAVQNEWVSRVLDVDVADLPQAPAGAPPGPVQFAKLRLSWETAKKAVAADLSQLRAEVMREVEDAELTANLKRLDEVLGTLNEGLGDLLDDLANTEPAKRASVAQRTQAIAASYLEHVLNDPLIDHIETNPFFDVAISGRLLGPLSAINGALGSYAAAHMKERNDA